MLSRSTVVRTVTVVAAAALVTAPARGQSAEGLLVVAHGATGEWNARVRETVAQVRWQRGPVALAFLMGPEAVAAGWDSAVAGLVRNGVTSITVVPLMVSSHGGHYRQIEYLAGRRDSWEEGGAGHEHAPRQPPPVPMRVTPALDAAPELGAAVAARWSALDAADRARPLVLIAHGPTTDAEAARWHDNLESVVLPALREAGLRADARIGLLRDDAPAPERARAVAGIRDTVSRLAASSGDSVDVIPLLISTGAINQVKIPRDLEGLPVRYVATPLAPRPELARWIERMAEGARLAEDAR